MGLNPVYKGNKKFSIFYPTIPENEVVNTEDLQKQLGEFISSNPKPYYIDLDSLPRVYNVVKYYCINIVCPVIGEFRVQVSLISLNIDTVMEASNRLEEFMQPLGKLFSGDQNYRLEVFPLINRKKNK